MTKTTYQLQTLTCPSCIKKIEGAVGAKPGVNDVKVMFNSSKVKIDHDDNVDTKSLKGLIEQLGYEVVGEK